MCVGNNGKHAQSALKQRLLRLAVPAHRRPSCRNQDQISHKGRACVQRGWRGRQAYAGRCHQAKARASRTDSMHRWPLSTHKVDADAPHNLACYSTGSFTTVRSWDQAGPTSALSRSRSQEKGRTEASDRRSRRRGRRYPRATGLTPRSAKAGILTSRHLSFRPKKKVGLKAERSPDATQPLGAPRSAMRASLRGVKNELTRVHAKQDLDGERLFRARISRIFFSNLG